MISDLHIRRLSQFLDFLSSSFDNNSLSHNSQLLLTCPSFTQTRRYALILRTPFDTLYISIWPRSILESHLSRSPFFATHCQFHRDIHFSQVLPLGFRQICLHRCHQALHQLPRGRIQAEMPEGMLGVILAEAGTGMFALSTTLLADCTI